VAVRSRTPVTPAIVAAATKAIRVSPYDILRLARYLCISTTQFIENHTEAGGTVLRPKENGDCGFLGERGCSVHADRPLVCRIYPLARWVSPDGDESFGHLTPHPKTEGVYDISGTVRTISITSNSRLSSR
jgi:Fe-S-cluster containining protein